MTVALVILLIGAGILWIQVLKPAPPAATGCNEPGPAPTSAANPPATTATTGAGAGPALPEQPTSASASADPTTSVSTTLGAFTDPNTLAAIRPEDPSQIPLRVLNASNVTGQAKTVTDELRDAGFTAIRQQDNDPLYPAADLRCYGEIRYGQAGLAEARTVLIIAPCAQLVVDDRADNSVDLSLGKLFEVQPVSSAIRDDLTTIKNASAPPPVIEGQTVAVRPIAPIPPLPDRAGCPA